MLKLPHGFLHLGEIVNTLRFAGVLIGCQDDDTDQQVESSWVTAVETEGHFRCEEPKLKLTDSRRKKDRDTGCGEVPFQRQKSQGVRTNESDNVHSGFYMK